VREVQRLVEDHGARGLLREAPLRPELLQLLAVLELLEHVAAVRELVGDGAQQALQEAGVLLRVDAVGPDVRELVPRLQEPPLVELHGAEGVLPELLLRQQPHLALVLLPLHHSVEVLEHDDVLAEVDLAVAVHVRSQPDLVQLGDDHRVEPHGLTPQQVLVRLVACALLVKAPPLAALGGLEVLVVVRAQLRDQGVLRHVQVGGLGGAAAAGDLEVAAQVPFLRRLLHLFELRRLVLDLRLVRHCDLLQPLEH
jgi:hypothetical protein